jgi:hypothetical protein
MLIIENKTGHLMHLSLPPDQKRPDVVLMPDGPNTVEARDWLELTKGARPDEGQPAIRGLVKEGKLVVAGATDLADLPENLACKIVLKTTDPDALKRFAKGEERAKVKAALSMQLSTLDGASGAGQG